MVQFFEDQLIEDANIAYERLKKIVVRREDALITARLLFGIAAKNKGSLEIENHPVYEPSDLSPGYISIEHDDINGDIAKVVFNSAALGGYSDEGLEGLLLIQLGNAVALVDFASRPEKEDEGPYADFRKGKISPYGLQASLDAYAVTILGDAKHPAIFKAEQFNKFHNAQGEFNVEDILEYLNWMESLLGSPLFNLYFEENIVFGEELQDARRRNLS